MRGFPRMRPANTKSSGSSRSAASLCFAEELDKLRLKDDLADAGGVLGGGDIEQAVA